MISRRRFLQSVTVLGTVGTSASAYALGIEPLVRLNITRYQFTPHRWPADLKLTIAVLADLHACRPWMAPERIRSIVEITNSLGADMVTLLGDYVAGHRYVSGPLANAEWAEALGGLRAPLGVHAVLGNHDWWDDRAVQRAGGGVPGSQRALEAVGIRVYQNEATRFVTPGGAFWLAGLGDQLAFWPMRRSRPGRRRGVDDIAGTLRQVTDDAPVVLMAHEPDVVVRVPERVSVTLSGHTHGGQVRLLGWSPVVPSRYGNRYAYGHIRERSDLIVSAGLGCSGVPVRFGIPPEIVLVTLGGHASDSDAPKVS
jgi:predicted MPP superfamily phosphohydrolase